jgi:hypothetical protein
METNYSVTITEVSKELTAKERIAFKDLNNAYKFDDLLDPSTNPNADAGLIITPSHYGVLDIHNDKSDNKDYSSYVIVDKDGGKYYTSSKSFWSSFMDIVKEMKDEDEEWSIEVTRHPSKNYKDKFYFTASII